MKKLVYGSSVAACIFLMGQANGFAAGEPVSSATKPGKEYLLFEKLTPVTSAGFFATEQK